MVWSIISSLPINFTGSLATCAVRSVRDERSKPSLSSISAFTLLYCPITVLYRSDDTVFSISFKTSSIDEPLSTRRLSSNSWLGIVTRRIKSISAADTSAAFVFVWLIKFSIGEAISIAGTELFDKALTAAFKDSKTQPESSITFLLEGSFMIFERTVPYPSPLNISFFMVS